MSVKVIYCRYVWMAPGKISCKLTGSPSVNKVFELNQSTHVHERQCV